MTESQKVLVDHKDWFLQLLVGFANDSAADPFIGVTLNVGGILISGEIISGDIYFKMFSAQLSSGGMPLEVAKDFEKLGAIYIKGREEDKEEKDKESPNFIHLKNTRFFHPGGTPIPTDGVVLWRGRISAVDGFILGIMNIT